MTFLPAKRSGIVPLIGIFGHSNTGKTYSSMLLMRGLVGPTGKFGVIDTENGRASINAGRPEIGEFDVLDLHPPFHPDRYREGLDALFTGGFAGGIIDSTSHEWNGSGGYLETKEEWLDQRANGDWKKREKLALAAAAQCKPAHTKLVAMLLRAPIPIILCFRGKDKVKMTKDANGKAQIEQAENSSPIQDSELIYEMLIAGETINPDGLPGNEGFFRITKYTHPDLLACLPKQGERLGLHHGEAMARWCSAASGAPKATPKPEESQTLTDIRLQITEAIDAAELNRIMAASGGLDQREKSAAWKAIKARGTYLVLSYDENAKTFIEP